MPRPFFGRIPHNLLAAAGTQGRKPVASHRVYVPGFLRAISKSLKRNVRPLSRFVWLRCVTFSFAVKFSRSGKYRNWGGRNWRGDNWSGAPVEWRLLERRQRIYLYRRRLSVPGTGTHIRAGATLLTTAIILRLGTTTLLRIKKAILWALSHRGFPRRFSGNYASGSQRLKATMAL